MFLDSSAIIVELDYDIHSLIQSNSMMAKSFNTKKDASNNDHVMLWNLNHPYTKDMSHEWMKECLTMADDEGGKMTGRIISSSSLSLSSLTMGNSLYKVQSEAILEKMLDNIKNDALNDGSSGMSNTSSSSSSSSSSSTSSNNQILIDAIPSGMVNGLQGTLVKQDMSYNDYMIGVSDLRHVMPIVTGIADSVCYRFYPQCEIV